MLGLVLVQGHLKKKKMDLLARLAAYHPTAEEVVTKERMMAFIQQYPDCFERTLEIGHITASAWLISPDSASVLLTHHAKLNAWLQLGGHCDGDLDVLRTALREAREESGIEAIEPVREDIFDIDIHSIPVYGAIKEHLHYDVRFLLQVKSQEPFVVSHESKKLAWFPKRLGALPTQERSILRMHEKWCCSVC
ncbi:MAG: NUDIX hydrolase [Chlamydiia bacterium]|nr:NUDIX hydrolase [Chlamydiia bacterium]